MTALVSLDGVLRTEVGDPIHEGLKLYRVLVMSYRVVLATDGTKAEAEHWLRANMLTGYADLLDNTIAYTGQDLRDRQLQVCRSGGLVELFVDSDTDRVARAYAAGVTSLMFAAPKFIRTKRQVKPWEDLKTELASQKELRARLTFDDLSAHQWE